MSELVAGDSKAAPPVRAGRLLALILASLGVGLFVFYMVIFTLDPRAAGTIAHDYEIYHKAALRLLSGGPWFLPEQTAGVPYVVEVGHVLYPPVAVPWLVPVSLLPIAVWWIVPALIVAGVVWHHRPSQWGWVGIAACLAWPTTAEHWVSANPSVWIVSAVALGTIWRPAFAFVFLKPSLFPFAFFGVRSRGWWFLVLCGAVLSLTLLPWTLQWFGVILNARGGFSGLLYGSRDVAAMLIPLIAWGTRTGSAPRRSAPTP